MRNGRTRRTSRRCERRAAARRPLARPSRCRPTRQTSDVRQMSGLQDLAPGAPVGRVRYASLAVVAAFIPAFLGYVLLLHIGFSPESEPPNGFLHIFQLLISFTFVPVAETMEMLGIIWVLRKLRLGAEATILITAGLLALQHCGGPIPVQGIVVFWPF